MCGILGVHAPQGPTERLAKAAALGLATLRHRGPDQQHSVVLNGACLGHARLAIVDPSPAAQQPFSDPSGRFWIVLGGEIYDFVERRAELEGRGHRFRTASDAEVALAAFMEWGIAFQERLNGMWALAIYDARERSLLLSRDRFGIKPLYWTGIDGQLGFASEMKALFAMGASSEPSWSWIAAYLRNPRFGDRSDRTAFRDIRALPPGHCLQIDRDGRHRLERWWSLDEQCEAPPSRYEDRVERFRELFEESVRLRLRNDAASGVALSGGMDSASIYGAAHKLAREGRISGASQAREQKELRAFTLSHPGSAIDEARWARECARHWQDEAALQVTTPSLANFGSMLDELIWHQEAPVWAPTVVALHQLYSQVSAAGVRVLLEGHGSDEMLGGYPFHIQSAIEAQLARGERLAAWRLASCYAATTGSPHPWHWGSTWKALRRARRRKARAGEKDVAPLGAAMRSLLTAAMIEVEPLERSRAPRGPHAFDTMLRHSFESQSLPMYLRVFDRATMAYGVESSPPFLDHHLVRYVFSLPDADKIGVATKRILRSAATVWMPPCVIARTAKQPFAVPQADWFGSPAVREVLGDVFHSRAALESEVFDGQRVAALMDDRQGAGFSSQERAALWSLLNVHLWQQRFV